MSNLDRFIIVDGVVANSKEAVIPVTSRGLMYGDGCFETFTAYEGRFFKLKEHLERLREGLKFLKINAPHELDIKNLYSQLVGLLQRNKLLGKKAVIRIQVWREGGRGYTVNSGASHYSVICSAAKINDKNTCNLATVDTKRIPSAALPSSYKLTNGLNYIIAANEAQNKKADDALMETIDGRISETTIANIFWLKNGTVYTPSKACDIIPGITRDVIMILLVDKLNVAVQEGMYSVDEVKAAEVVWICNSVKEIQAVSCIDETHFSIENPFISKLQSCFKSYLNKQLSDEV